MLNLLINGERPADFERAIAVADRGLHYGDGLFETMWVYRGRVRFLADHLARLAKGCARLGLPAPDLTLLQQEIDAVTEGAERGVLKVLMTRGVGGRGYAPPEECGTTRIVALYPAPPSVAPTVTVDWCRVRLGRNAMLAGIKHLNRLEQVLAQRELGDRGIDEGLMLDSEDELIGAVAGNVFVVHQGVLLTPDLRFCGVEGVMRKRVIIAAAALQITVRIQALTPEHVAQADEVFITNAVRGVRSVVAMGAQRLPEGAVAERVRSHLRLRM